MPDRPSRRALIVGAATGAAALAMRPIESMAAEPQKHGIAVVLAGRDSVDVQTLAASGKSIVLATVQCGGLVGVRCVNVWPAPNHGFTIYLMKAARGNIRVGWLVV